MKPYTAPPERAELAVYGLYTVEALSSVRPESIKRLFLRQTLVPRFRALCKRLSEDKKPYKLCDDDELARICKSRHHQGIAAVIDAPPLPPLSNAELENWAEHKKRGLILAGIGDDHNIGAILRSAAFFGWDYAVLAGGQQGCFRLSAAAYRVAEGAAEHIILRTAGKTAQEAASFVEKAARRLLVIGADPNYEKGQIFEGGRGEKSAQGLAQGLALVLGNESEGLPSEIKDKCNCLVRVKGSGAVESLNVSAAAAILIARFSADF